jgi:hypothetical protein
MTFYFLLMALREIGVSNLRPVLDTYLDKGAGR